MRFMNSAASGPTTSILPSVEASKMPTDGAHRPAFARHGGVHVLAAAREIARALPLADVLEHRALLLRPFVDRRLAHRIEQRAARRPRSVPNVTGV
jgi:hypothetical protein